MKKLIPYPLSLAPNYLRTLRNYFRTPKARHDLKDFARAALIIFSTALIIFILIRRWAA
ncbi:MAG: hypothetical protein IJG80_08185 [Selenomonadaceae bacterium]|nr:hypothetical protein [Selenomonadaceae bacterium]MBQ3727143.1 hypothetical protein [Selenomonadaceae bacterium]